MRGDGETALDRIRSLEEWIAGYGQAYRNARQAWRLVDEAHKRAKRISERAIPAIADAALEAIEARTHLDRSIAAMTGGVGAAPKDDE